MKYSGYLDYITLQKWGIRYDKAGPMLLFDWLYTVPSWAESITTNAGEVFYFANRTRAIEELPFLPEKIDTIYRWYKELEELGLIVLKKVEGKDYIMLTEKAREWGRKTKGRTEIRDSDQSPSKLGPSSEKEASTPYSGKETSEKSATHPPNAFLLQKAVNLKDEVYAWSVDWIPKFQNQLTASDFDKASLQASVFYFLNRQDDEGKLKGRSRKDLTEHFMSWAKTQKSFLTDKKWVEEFSLEFRQTINWYKKANNVNN